MKKKRVFLEKLTASVLILSMLASCTPSLSGPSEDRREKMVSQGARVIDEEYDFVRGVLIETEEFSEEDFASYGILDGETVVRGLLEGGDEDLLSFLCATSDGGVDGVLSTAKSLLPEKEYGELEKKAKEIEERAGEWGDRVSRSLAPAQKDEFYKDLKSMVETYTYKEDTICVNGKYYLAAHMEDAEGQYVTRGTVNWQFFNTIMLSTNIVLDATNVGLQTANASLALPSLGLKSLSYAKYLKAGPKVLGLATTGVKDVWKKTKAQSKRWSDMKKASVDAESLSWTLNDQQKAVFNKCIYIIEIKDVDEEYTTIKEIFSNKTEEQIKEEQEKYLKELASATVLPEDEKKSLDNLDDSELEKYAL